MGMFEELKALDPTIFELSLSSIKERTQMIKAETRVLKSEINNIKYEISYKEEAISDNHRKISMNKQLPYIVGSVIETMDGDDGKAAVVSTVHRAHYYLPMIGLVDDAKPGDSVALHKDSNIVFEVIPPDFDTRVKAMELDEAPDETYDDVGGLERQIEDLNEAIVFPLLHPEKFEKLNIKAPKGVLMYGPPGTGKTLMARACAALTKATFLKLAGPQLVQMYIGDGARLVRDAFALAKSKAPTVIFIDEIDAIGSKRTDSDRTGDREVQRTMLELLNQLDGFSSVHNVKIIAATNRADILDPALVRSGRLDRKIEFPLPNVEGRKRILQIHARKMNIGDVNFDELARSTEGFNGAQCKAVCVEAGMVALRNNGYLIKQSDFLDGIQEVMAKKKSKLVYFT